MLVKTRVRRRTTTWGVGASRSHLRSWRSKDRRTPQYVLAYSTSALPPRRSDSGPLALSCSSSHRPSCSTTAGRGDASRSEHCRRHAGSRDERASDHCLRFVRVYCSRLGRWAADLAPICSSLHIASHCTLSVFLSSARRACLQTFRPPTPPLPARNPKLRSPGHSRASSESHTNTVSATTAAATGGPRIRASDRIRPSQQLSQDPPRVEHAAGLGPRRIASTAEASHSPDLRNRSNAHPPNPSGLSKQRMCEPTPAIATAATATAAATATVGVRRWSADSAAETHTAGARRSQLSCRACFGVWYALKTLGHNLRAKVGGMRRPPTPAKC